MKYKRIFTIVIDSLGIGALPDAEHYGDTSVNTLSHISQSVNHFSIPNLQKLGIANICSLKHVAPVERLMGYCAKLGEMSIGKDTMTGHWEMMGLCVTKPFPTFTESGFPKELIYELERRTGHKIIGNRSASGTKILDELAEEEITTGSMIVYTSGDSVMQICGNEDTFDLKELYRCCEVARELTLKDEWKVARIVARPYIGKKKGQFKRTSNRRDYALKPFNKTVLNALKESGYDVISIGKIVDIFSGDGITESHRSQDSKHGIDQTIEIVKRDFTGLCFTNLSDFDSLWGHRRNPVGYAQELEYFDIKLGILMDCMKNDDLLIVTADHGNDPTYKGTDHTREYVPFLAYSPSILYGGKLQTQSTFAVVGATIADNFNISMPKGTIGNSLLSFIN